MKKAITVLLLCLISLQLIAGTNTKNITSGQAINSFNWWNPNYALERNITVTNPYNQSFMMKPVLVNVDFEPGHLVSAIKELRIVNGTGYEVPSFIVSENYSGGFVTSVQLLFLVNIPANDSQTYQLYYGNPMAVTPYYRSNSIASVLHSGVLTLTALGYQQASNLNISIANTFFLSVYDKLSIGSSVTLGQDYGSPQIASSEYTIERQWRSIGSLPIANFSASELSYFAGQLKVIKLLLAYNNTFDLITTLSNPSSTSITSLKMTQLIDFSQLASLGVSGVSYNSTSNILYGYVGGTYAGFSSNITPQHVDVGYVQSIINVTRLNNLTNNFYSAGPSAAAVTYGLYGLQPSNSVSFETVWSVASSAANLSNQIAYQFKNLQVSLGKEVYISQYLPNSVIVWKAAFDASNITVPSTGTLINLPLKIFNWVPESFSYNGTIYYNLPGPSFSASSAAWLTRTSFTGNASSYASSKFFSTTLGTYTSRVASWVFSPNGTSSAMLISNNYTVQNSLGANLSLFYSTDILASNNSRVQPFAYLALDIDPTLKGNYTTTVVFPLQGSALPSNTKLVQNLIADGNWHQLTIALAHLINSKTFEFRLRIVSYSPPGFVGQVELNFVTASISWSDQINGLLSATLGSSSPSITINYRPSQVNSPPVGTLELNSTFLAIQQLNFTASSGSSFVSIVKSPSSNLQLTPHSMIVFSDYYLMNPTIYFNGSRSSPIQQLSPMLLISGSEIPLRQTTNTSLTAIDLNFTGAVLNTVVLNSDRKPVQGASILLEPIGSPLSISLYTNSSGYASIQLLPWTYLMNVYYQGYQLYSVFIGLNQSQTMIVNASIYNIVIEAKTQGGKPLTNYPISVSTRNFTLQGMTDIKGMFSFPAIANAIYVVNITQPDGSQISQAVRASMNNEIFSIITPYHSAQTQIIIETAAAIVIIVAALSLYIFSRRGSAR